MNGILNRCNSLSTSKNRDRINRKTRNKNNKKKKDVDEKWITGLE